MENQFQIGQTVRLKSGSPLMTINFIEDRFKVSCVWFNADGKVEGHTFFSDALKHEDDEIDLDSVLPKRNY